MLEMAASFFSLIAAEAAAVGGELRLAGVAIRDKCAAVEVRVSDDTLAMYSAERTLRVLEGSLPAPPKAAQQVHRFRKAARAFDKPDHRVVALGIDWQKPVPLVLRVAERPLDSLINIRAKLVRIGGSTPAARFDSLMEREEFTLNVNEAQCRELGPHVYLEGDLEALVERDSDGKIIGGKVLSFEVVEEVGRDPWVAWEQWYREVNQED